MIVEEEEFRQYEKAINHYFKQAPEQPGKLAIQRKELTDLTANKYIYIYDNYEELKAKFDGRR